MNATKANHNASTTVISSTHSSITISLLSLLSSSIVNMLSEQPSVLLVVYPMPFVHECNELLMEK